MCDEPWRWGVRLRLVDCLSLEWDQGMVCMVWYGAPSTPRQCVLSLTVVASCSVHPVSERHRQAVQSALVRRWVRPCDADREGHLTA
jgi:hypothetical protein